MRFVFAAAAALLAAIVTAQDNAISIPEGSSTLQVNAGEPLTIDWTNPSDSTVTIKLQQDPIQPDGGITLASGIPASLGSATLQIPDAADVNSFQYTIQIIDDSNPDNYNFSPNFGIVGATGTSVATASTASGTASATGSSNSTATSSGTASETTETSSETTSGSSSSRTGSATTTTSSSSSSRTSAASSSESTAASETTSAPSSSDNGASGLKVQGGLFALAVAVVAAVI